MTKNKNNKWSAPQSKEIRSIDISAILFKPSTKSNPYLRTPTYRRKRSVPMTGTNSECY